ncbi:hypothetical protein L226DRAFT_36928 [Lentinus tigrinus ALCF2SS1-7]|uniref:Uncharacterized protein n=1 Tax=Lentinus tigrinus ALCF2SS1-6 TaxID=1328759 RepID=A0A5C2SLM5_9APHY|nr:hypothetical protein L227DRAFT_266719 [Lentinus tigrinus ALCF2SS1-6]RPD82771.1 hypothetical protein L226DRAFT_36928 [Lentinus tigrinus ALCF2SS1-7]
MHVLTVPRPANGNCPQTPSHRRRLELPLQRVHSDSPASVALALALLPGLFTTRPRSALSSRQRRLTLTPAARVIVISMSTHCQMNVNASQYVLGHDPSDPLRHPSLPQNQPTTQYRPLMCTVYC